MSDEQFGALPVGGGVRFRVWAPSVSRLSLILLDGAAAGRHDLPRDAEGVSGAFIEGAQAGDRYQYCVDNRHARPDPASRFQPDGVHGPSQVIDPSAFRWTDDHWR